MIAKMDQLTVVGRRGVAKEVLQSLQNLGVVQVDPLDFEGGTGLQRVQLKGEDRAEAERWRELLSRSESLLAVLEPHGEGKQAARTEAGVKLAELESWLSGVGSSVDALVAERADARDELDLIGTYLPVYRQVAPTLARLEASDYLEGTAIIASARDAEELRAALDESLAGRFELATREFERDVIILVASMKEDRQKVRSAISRTGLSPLELPLRYRSHGTAKAVHVMEERSQALPRRLKAVDEELARLAEAHTVRLRQVHQQASNHTVRYEIMGNLAEGDYSFALRGWVPSDNTRNVTESLRRHFAGDVVVESRPADMHHDVSVPTKLENKPWARPFEILLSLFAPAAYGGFDPTWTVAVFFPLYFGIVVGDMGFGLMFLALGLWLRSRGLSGKGLSLGPLNITIDSETLPKVGVITIWAGIWTIIWGFIYGEFLGNFLERWPVGNPVFFAEGHGDGMLQILLFRVEVFDPLLVLALGFGVLQVVGGWIIRAYYGFVHKDRKHLFEGIGMAAGLLAITVFAWAFLSGNLGTAVFTICGVGFLIFLIGVFVAGMPLMLVELISNSGHILSYLRLFAVGLSAALVANLATDLGFAIAGVAPVIGPILGIVIALSVHVLAIVLTLIGHTLQPLRLQYVEFFTKFGFYENPGRPYKPFRLTGGKA